jgi:hypothetical protein
MSCDHSLGWKNILKFFYYFMILFLIVYILNIFKYHLITKRVQYYFYFKFDYLLLN